MYGQHLTIFTPTYNRSSLLVRLYDSLCHQSVKAFEWIIIDDASVDDTLAVTKTFNKAECGFDVCYCRQEHGGKHRALNKGFQMARGEYFFIVDDDDYLVDNAVEKILEWIQETRDNKELAGIAGLKISESGKVWGDEKPLLDKAWIDASIFERKKYHLTGDKAEIYKTELLRKHPFPEYEGEYFMTEDVCWDAIAAEGYKLRWYNEPIYICEYLEQGLTKSGANAFVGHRDNYQGYCHYIRQCLGLKNKRNYTRNFYGFNRTGKRLNKKMSERACDLDLSVWRYVIYLFFEMPVRYLLYICRITN